MQFTTAALAIFSALACILHGWAFPAAIQKNSSSLASFFITAIPGIGATDLPSTALDLGCTQPSVTTEESLWSNEDFIRTKIENPLLKAPIFWSGTTGGKSVLEAAEKCTQRVVPPGYTLGMALCEHRAFTMPAAAATSSKANHLWDVASEVFAKNAVGTAFVTFGESVNPQGTWARVEFPALRANKNIHSVVQIDPGNCGEQCFWICNNLPECKGLQKCPNAP